MSLNSLKFLLRSEPNFEHVRPPIVFRILAVYCIKPKIIRSFGPSLPRNSYCPKLCNSLKLASLFRNTIDGTLPYINYMVLLNVKLKETGRNNYVITFLRPKLITKKESYNGK